MRIYPNTTVDYEFQQLGSLGHSGSLNDRQFSFLRTSGYRGALADMLAQYLNFSPLNLFTSSEPGVWLDPSDLSTLFQDTAGTTPVTAAGQSVGLVLDKSKGLVLGPELLTNGDFSAGSTGWVVSNADATHIATFSGGTLRYQSDTTSPALLITQPNILTAGKTYQVDVFVSSYVSGAIKSDQIAGQTGFVNKAGLNRSISVALASGSIGFTRSSTNVDMTIDYISVKELPGNHATQSVFASRPIYRVTSGIPNLEDDLIDDSLNWTAPAGSYTVAWCDTAGNVTIQAAQALSGATDVLMAQRMVGYLAINRALTAAETANLTAWLQRKAGGNP